MAISEPSAQPPLEELRRRRREAAERVRYILHELERAEFERAKQAQQDALEGKAA